MGSRSGWGLSWCAGLAVNDVSTTGNDTLRYYCKFVRQSHGQLCRGWRKPAEFGSVAFQSLEVVDRVHMVPFLMPDHDHPYKEIFGDPDPVADLLRLLFPDEAPLIDFASLDRRNGSYVAEDWRERENDVIWRVRWGGEDLYVYLLLEFQSEVVNKPNRGGGQYRRVAARRPERSGSRATASGGRRRRRRRDWLHPTGRVCSQPLNRRRAAPAR